uniref:(California timema) hypothetical protein n=1 Tax=Timema californicum TaxID=61474 RepID=A0A7R9IXN3_TIMCA|nr:unnamed protein product [Timema californicum]
MPHHSSLTLVPFFIKGYIREFLCLVPHNQKFCFSETADVLHRSASTKEDFSGYRAASAWNAIGAYAGNLLAQPWRKEYREMKILQNGSDSNDLTCRPQSSSHVRVKDLVTLGSRNRTSILFVT